ANANDAIEEAAELRKLHKPDTRETFHDFRKRLRAATKIAGYLPQLFQAGDAKSLPLLIETADRYGEVNDKLVAYELAKEKGDDAKADALVDEIAAKWKELRRWQRS